MLGMWNSKEQNNSKHMNFIDPQSLQNLYVMSNPTTPNSTISRRAFTAKLFSGRPVIHNINQSMSSPSK